jgi:4-amino-4-deoxychorismate lyase
MSLLFETVLIRSSKPVNEFYHTQRFNQARKHFWDLPPADLFGKISLRHLNPDLQYRCRIEYTRNIEAEKIEPLSVRVCNSLKIVVADDIDYSFKYCRREKLELLYTKKENADDVLIIKDNFITDSSIANIVFSDGQKFFTPSTPLLKGTQRAYLIDSGIIQEETLTTNDLKYFKFWQIINALNPFDKKRFVDIQLIF